MIMDSPQTSGVANALGIITGLVTLAGFLFTTYHWHLPRAWITYLQKVVDELEGLHSSALEQDAYREGSFSMMSDKISKHREQLVKYKSRSDIATTWLQQYKEFFKGLSWHIYCACSAVKQTNQQLLAIISDSGTDTAEETTRFLPSSSSTTNVTSSPIGSLSTRLSLPGRMEWSPTASFAQDSKAQNSTFTSAHELRLEPSPLVNPVSKTALRGDNYRTRLNELKQTPGFNVPRIIWLADRHEGPPNAGIWTSVAQMNGFEYQGTAGSKADAKEQAAMKIVEVLIGGGNQQIARASTSGSAMMPGPQGLFAHHVFGEDSRWE